LTRTNTVIAVGKHFQTANQKKLIT